MSSADPSVTTAPLARSAYSEYQSRMGGSVPIVKSVSVQDSVWSDCEKVLRYSVVLSYVLTFLILLILLAVVLRFSTTVVVLAIAVAAIISVIMSLMVSKKSCFKSIGLSD